MTCTITGTALPLTNIDSDRKQRLFIIILVLLRQGYTDFYLNCEKGVILCAAEAICILKKKLSIGLHIAVPFENQSSEWSEEDRDRYYAIHENADTVEFICHRFQPDCYQLADKVMLDKSDLLLILGEEASGCTAAAYATEIGVAVRYAGI